MSSDQEPRLDRADLTELARDLVGRDDAEDVAQDAWLLLFRQPPGRVRNMAAWLRVAILHLAMRSRQRDRRRAERERIVARPDLAPSVVEQLERKSLQDFLAALVDELGEPYREVIRLRYLEDREIEEIATLVGRSPATVRSQLKRGLDRLRARLGERPGHCRSLVFLFFSRLARRRGKNLLPALVAGIAAGVLILLVFGGDRPPRDERLSSVRAEERSVIALVDAGRTPASRISVAPPASASVSELDRTWSTDLEGVVLDPDDTPVSGATIVVSNVEGSDAAVVGVSDPSGHYTVRGVDGRRMIWAETAERIPSHRQLVGSRVAGSLFELRLGDPLGSSTGRVLFDGRPVPEAEVVWLGSGLEPKGFFVGEALELKPLSLHAFTAADGTFPLGHVPGDGIRLLVLAEGHAPKSVALAHVARERHDLEIVLEPPCVVTGRLLRPDGTPLAGGHLELVFLEPLPRREVETDEGGMFRFESLPSGPYLLRLLEDARARYSCFVEGSLREGEQLSRDVTVDERHAIRGRVLDGERPVAGRIVELEEKGASRFPLQKRRTSTALDGGFAFSSCCLAGSHVLRLLSRNEATVRVTAQRSGVIVDGEETILREDATPTGSLSGRFESDDPALMPVLAVLRGTSFEEPLLMRVDPASGEFSAADVPAGNHNLRAWIPRLGTWIVGRIDVPSGRACVRHEQVPRTGWLRFRVELENDADWQDLVATIAAPAFQDSLSDRCTLRMQALPVQALLVAELLPGDYEATLSLGGAIRESSLPVHIESGETVEADLCLRETTPMTLQLGFERPLRENERLTLFIEERDRQRSRPVMVRRIAVAQRSLDFVGSFARDTRELRVETSFGLTGKLRVEPAEIVPGGTLRIDLVEPGG